MTDILLSREEWDELHALDSAFRTGYKRVSTRNIISFLLNDFDDTASYGSAYPIWSRRFGVLNRSRDWERMLALEREFTDIWTNPENVVVDDHRVAFGNDKPSDKPIYGQKPKPYRIVKPKVTVTEKTTRVAPTPAVKVTPVEPKPVVKKPVVKKPVVKKPVEPKPVVEKSVETVEKPAVVAETKPKAVAVKQTMAKRKFVAIDKAQVYAGEILDEKPQLAMSDGEFDSINAEKKAGKTFPDSVLIKFYITQLGFLRPVTQDEANEAYEFIRNHVKRGGLDDDV